MLEQIAGEAVPDLAGEEDRLALAAGRVAAQHLGDDDAGEAVIRLLPLMP